MRKNFLQLLTILSNVTGCTKEQEIAFETEPAIENIAPKGFYIIVDTTTDKDAIIAWKPSIDPEGENITYALYLNEELITDNYSDLSYSFKNLSPETQYVGFPFLGHI